MHSSLSWCKPGLLSSVVELILHTNSGPTGGAGAEIWPAALTQVCVLTQDCLCPVEGEPWASLHEGGTWASLSPTCPPRMNLPLSLSYPPAAPLPVLGLGGLAWTVGPGPLTTPPFCLSSQAVKSGLRTTCKCHGVSGSCAVRTCWKQLSPFRETGQALKLRYDSAVKVSSATNEALGRLELWAPARPGSPTKGLAPRPGDLVYMEDSPSFCRPSKYSPGTAGRVCSREASCSSLCCGRGYDTQSRLVAFSCHCQVQWCCYVECQQCVQEELVYTCKH